MIRDYIKKEKELNKHLFDSLINSSNSTELGYYELLLTSNILAPILCIAGIIGILVGLKWNLSTLSIVLFFIAFTISAVCIHFISRTIFNNVFKTHIIALLTSICSFITFIIYYERITVIFWFILILITLIAIINTNRIFLIYISILYYITFIIIITVYRSDVVMTDSTFYAILFLMLLLIQNVSILSNAFYRKIIYRKILQFQDISSQKEEMSGLYEEILATEEELRDQNIKLNHYTDEIKSNQERLEYLAYNDTLTGLPNRKFFLEQLEIFVDMSEENGHSFAVVFIDLDNFKKINDSLGHAAGDVLLIQVANRLSAALDHKDILGRLGGDELALLIRRRISNELLLSYIQGICNLFNEPFKLENITTKVTASFGISIWPQDGINSEELLKAADVAMYKAKDMGRNAIQFYKKDMKDEILSKLEMENNLIKSIEKNELFIEYQPLFDTPTKKVTGFEALLRWDLPGIGRISPSIFIPFAEDIGFIQELGEWVIKETCKKINDIKARFHKDIVIAINVSSLQMKNLDFVHTVKRIIEEEGVNASSLEFEITESIFINNMAQAILVLNKIKELGIRISMDDFGTGYSSLSYLMRLPIDTLKIDKTFIDEIHADDQKNSLIGGIISMAHSLNMNVVAEGVETSTQLDFLEGEKCNIIQGFLLGRPLGADQLDAFIKTNL